jgi:hypothetical protein
MELYSKKNYYYYFSLVAKLVIVVACCVFAVISFTKLATKGYDKRLLILMIAGYFVGALCIYRIKIQLKRIHDLVVTKRHVIIKDKKYAITDITQISFTGMKPYGGMENTEGMQITFNGNKILYVYDRYYSNIAEIKRFFEQTYQPEAAPQNKGIKIPDKVYKGGFWSDNTIIVSIYIVAGLSMLTFFTDNFLKLMGGFFLFLGFLCLTIQFNYFVIEDGSIIIKKFILPVYSRRFNLGDVKEVVFETGLKVPNGMHLIKTDYTKSRLYFAASLYNKHWRKLALDLEQAGITVRDEIGITKHK